MFYFEKESRVLKEYPANQNIYRVENCGQNATVTTKKTQVLDEPIFSTKTFFFNN